MFQVSKNYSGVETVAVIESGEYFFKFSYEAQ